MAGAKLSILVITYNRPKDTLELLQTLQSQNEIDKYLGEILLLNNSSTESYIEVEEYINNTPELKVNYIRHAENLGVARGRNYLIPLAKFPILVTLDDDFLLPDQNSLKKIAHFFDRPEYQKKNTGAITFNVFYTENNQRQITAFPHKNVDKYQDKEWFFTYYFIGCANVIKREVFEKTGLYPEDFFYGMEEYDLSYRIIEAGYTLGYDNSVIGMHKESPLGRVPHNDKIAMLWYNKSKVAWRYLPNKYYYSTAIMWGLQYLLKTKMDLRGFFKTWRKVIGIPKVVIPQKIGNTAMEYLKSVEARLWY